MNRERLEYQDATREGSTIELIGEYETAYSGLNLLDASDIGEGTILLAPSPKTDVTVIAQTRKRAARARRAARRAA